ncbi:Calcineurin-like phosphoesterase [Musa troglodytarum]|uniref:Calcineurin-like phosphoesterase n=1 Tax=Musa troglodytarum TaxID=320322 RepID=A0A9E7L761_9LILI|nr:Calcineurin-like phosphoesterase [Musa troglodytarum]
MDFSQDNFDYAGPKQGKETSLSWDFIKHISNDATSNPKVLLTHIPLYRPDDTPCGSHRSSSVINQRISYAGTDHGISYQNYLSEETSNHLLDLIRPTLVLSGHDHDQCTVVHPTPAGTVTEHTVGTVSWQQGNLYPSFMLLSARSNLTNSEDAVSTNLCFLPMQTHIYIWYLTQFVITLILIIMWPTNGLGLSDKCMSYIRAMKNNLMATSKEKDEEENCEYEMVWDADGSMHLVKNARTREKGCLETNSKEAFARGRGICLGRLELGVKARRHGKSATPKQIKSQNTGPAAV